MTAHTGFKRKRRVIVGLKNGEKIIGKFLRTDYKKKKVIIETDDDSPEEPTEIKLNKIRFIGYYRAQPKRS